MAYISLMSASEAPPDDPKHNKSGISAEQQGSNIPLGWKPTEAHPVPVVRCVQIKKDGERCKRWSIRGYTKCLRHAGPGARMKDGNVSQYAAAVIEAGRLRLIDEVDPAIDNLLALMEPGTGEAIRLKATTEVLDRAGIRGGIEIEVTGDVMDSPADELAKRLLKLRAGAEAVQRMKEERVAADAEVVDAEIVEEDTPLFDLEPTDGDDNE